MLLVRSAAVSHISASRNGPGSGTLTRASPRCAVYSIGAINQENNGALTAAISELLEKDGVPNDRIYLNFFDVPRANCGWSSKTFAG